MFLLYTSNNFLNLQVLGSCGSSSAAKHEASTLAFMFFLF